MTNLVEVELAPNEKRCSKCKEVKDRGEFYKDKYRLDGLKPTCKECDIAIFRKRVAGKREALALNGVRFLTCPVCYEKVEHLTNHAIKRHNINREDLRALGVGETLAPAVKERLLNNLKRPNFARRVGNFVRIKSNYLDYPKSFKPIDCEFVKVKIEKEKLQIHFNPISKKLSNSKKVVVNGQRVMIYMHQEILSHLEIFRPIFELRKGAGFYIQFYEQDEAIFDIFSFWAKAGYCMTNTAHVRIYPNSRITIADHLWPLNAEYCYLEWVTSKRKNTPDYLDLLPVSRTGFIVGGNNLEFKQYIGLENCYKLRLEKRRLRTSAKSFLQDNNIPSGDWDLKEILPSGALRFRLYKERQPKEQRQDIAS